MTGVCPCCGQRIADGESLVVSLETNTASRLGTTVQLTPRMAEILTVLRGRYPGSANTGGLIRAIYGHRDEPASAYTALRVHISYLRRRLAPLGVAIEVTYTAGWRLAFMPVAIDLEPPATRRRRAAHAKAA